MTTCETNYELQTYVDYVDPRRVVISGGRSVHKELVSMYLEGYGVKYE